MCLPSQNKNPENMTFFGKGVPADLINEVEMMLYLGRAPNMRTRLPPGRGNDT